MVGLHPGARIGEPEHIGYAVFFLVDRGYEFVTGTRFAVERGWRTPADAAVLGQSVPAWCIVRIGSRRIHGLCPSPFMHAFQLDRP